MNGARLIAASANGPNLRVADQKIGCQTPSRSLPLTAQILPTAKTYSADGSLQPLQPENGLHFSRVPLMFVMHGCDVACPRSEELRQEIFCRHAIAKSTALIWLINS